MTDRIIFLDSTIQSFASRSVKALLYAEKLPSTALLDLFLGLGSQVAVTRTVQDELLDGAFGDNAAGSVLQWVENNNLLPNMQDPVLTGNNRGEKSIVNAISLLQVTNPLVKAIAITNDATNFRHSTQPLYGKDYAYLTSEALNGGTSIRVRGQ